VGITAGSIKYQEEKACEKRHPYRIIIIIIIIIINFNRSDVMFIDGEQDSNCCKYTSSTDL